MSRETNEKFFATMFSLFLVVSLLLICSGQAGWDLLLFVLFCMVGIGSFLKAVNDLSGDD